MSMVVPQDSPRIFSLAGYCSLLREFRSRGYRLCSFSQDEVKPEAPQLFLRHDVDMSLARAVRMAAAEAEEGVRSAYFVLLRGPLYNLFDKTNSADLCLLRDFGHEIGLHFDPTVYVGADAGRRGDWLGERAAAEAKMLSEIAECPIRVVSFHRPSPDILGLEGRIGGLLHTYAAQFFKEIAYVSDSGGSWRYGHPMDHTSVAERRALQLLVHPIWWTSNAPMESPVALLDEFADGKDRAFRRALAGECIPYRARFPDQTCWEK